MTSYIKSLVLVVLMVCGVGAASAQNSFPTPAPGKFANGVVAMCLNAQGQAVPQDQNGTCPGASVSVTITFPTIGAAVPPTAIYNSLNVAGTLRGWTGVNPSGSIYAGQVDIASWAGTTVASGAGVVTAGTPRITQASDSPEIAALGAPADAACATDNGTCSAIALIKRGNQTATTTATAVQGAIPAGTNTIGTVGQLPYPVGSTPYTATATGTTGATTATLAGASSVTTYLCGFSIRANATAAATGNATVTGVITATLNFTQWTAPNASGLGITEMIFAPCIPASGTNQSVAVVSAAPGTGGVVSVTAWGYKL